MVPLIQRTNARPRPDRREPAYSFVYEPGALPPSGWESADVRACLAELEPALRDPLNGRQRDAIAATFGNRIAIIWGPPGTGKTTVLGASALAWVLESARRGTPMAVCVGAATYAAIDNVLREIRALAHRAVSARTFDGRAAPVAIAASELRLIRVRSASSEPPPESREIEDIIAGQNGAAALVQALETADVAVPLIVGGTWRQLTKLIGNSHGRPWFDLMLLDEASQIKTALAAPYALLCKPNAHLTLGGDDQQLGPIHHFAVEPDASGLLDSLYAHYRKGHGIKPIQLRDNYRTNAEIAAWPSERFYEGQYEAIYPSRRLPLASQERGVHEGGSLNVQPPAGWPGALPWTPVWRELLEPEPPVAVLTYPAGSATVANEFEAGIVSALATLYRLRTRAPTLPGIHENQEVTGQTESGAIGTDEQWFWSQQLGIVTPHRAQRALVARLLGETRVFARPQAATVEVFQGQERDLVLVSYTVSDPDFVRAEDEFLLNPRRFNVALTRARMKCLIIVSEAVLTHLPGDRRIAEAAAHLQLFAEQHCRLARHLAPLPYRSVDGVTDLVGATLRWPPARSP